MRAMTARAFALFVLLAVLATAPGLSGCKKDSGGGAECGNGVVEAGEVCDGTSVGDHTCEDEGLWEGTVVCSADCASLDYSDCSGSCGDGLLNGPEACDGSELDGRDCVSEGLYPGTLSCHPSCMAVDTSACGGLCGEGVANGDEECDGLDIGGLTCDDLGLGSGALACAPDCTFDTGPCSQTNKVVINEITMDWPDTVELLNLSPVTVDLAGWTLDCHGEDDGIDDVVELVLPSYALAPGARVMLYDDTSTATGYPEVDLATRSIYFEENVNWHGGPITNAAVLKNALGSGVDFVRWGEDAVAPPPGTSWTDASAILIGQVGDSVSLSRVPDGVDTDTSADFCVTRTTDGSANAVCMQPTADASLLITEIQQGATNRIELYNAGTVDVQLEGWAIYWFYDYDSSGGGSTLPAYVLVAGQYIELVDDIWDAPTYENNGVIHIHSIDWYAGYEGGAGLIDPAGQGRDFVRWGVSAAQPWYPDLFTDWVIKAPMPGSGESLGRWGAEDYNTAWGWCLQAPSFGAPNTACQ